jgi:prepilin-type N-terminal cleavage/methylation domain-containing protein
MTNRRNLLRGQRGFSLGELLVACAIVGLIMAGTFVALRNGEDAYQYGVGKVEVNENGRAGVDRMIHELRTASTITAANQTSITFQYVDETGTTVTVAYSLAGTNLQRNQTAPAAANPQPEVIVGGINTLDLRYYDSTNTVTATVANIKSVDVRVITQPQATGLGSYNLANQRATFEDRVRPRNL